MAASDETLYPLGETDYAVPPGETLQELLEESGLTQRDLARRAALSPKHVNRLLKGLVPLSADVAQRLERVTGTPARIWNRLEANYRSDLERLHIQRDLVGYSAWLKGLPVKALVQRGFVPREPADEPSRVEQMLRFFGVASVAAWDEVYAELPCAFRKSKAYEAEPGPLAAWLRLGELAAQKVHTAPFDRKGLRSALPELRALTEERSEVFHSKLQEICAAHGVAVVLIEEIAGARSSGATRWLTPDKALVQLSMRYRTDDQLWFTLFHEIGHVLLHGKTEVWIEDGSSGAEDPKEAEADRFSRDVLIPPADAHELPGLTSDTTVRAFAARIGVAPGIVVGRLQHDEHWPYSRGNNLKRRLVLAEAETVPKSETAERQRDISVQGTAAAGNPSRGRLCR
jgi:HTH-type transcriptional regulator/antitoxin HigA